MFSEVLVHFQTPTFWPEIILITIYNSHMQHVNNRDSMNIFDIIIGQLNYTTCDIERQKRSALSMRSARRFDIVLSWMQ